MSVKKWLPLLCAVVMVLGSSMTVFASVTTTTNHTVDYGYSTIDDIKNVDVSALSKLCRLQGSMSSSEEDYTHLLVIDSTTHYDLYLSSTPYVYSITGGYVYNSGGSYVHLYYYTAEQCDKGESVGVPNKCSYTFQSAMTDKIYVFNETVYNTEGNVFFQIPLVTMAKVLPEMIATQAVPVVMIAICCLALVIGSTVLVPRLRRYLG